MMMNGEPPHHTRVSLFAPQSFTETISMIESLSTTQKLYKVDGDRDALMSIPPTTVTLFIKSIGFTETLTREFVRSVLQAGSCGKIKSLYMLDCEFVSLVTLLKPFQRVQHLSITASKLKNFAELPLLPNVISLHLDGNFISSWAHFPDAPKLTFLSLNYNRLESFIQFPFAKLRNLEIFSAVGNNLESILPSPVLSMNVDREADDSDALLLACDDSLCTAMSIVSLFLQGRRVNSINSMSVLDIMSKYSDLIASKTGRRLLAGGNSVARYPSSDAMLSSHKLLEQRMITEEAFLAEVDSTLPYRTLHGLSMWISNEGVEYLQRPGGSMNSLQFRTYCSRFLHKQELVLPILRAEFMPPKKGLNDRSRDVYTENDQCFFQVTLLSHKYKLVEALFYHTCFGSPPQLIHGVHRRVDLGTGGRDENSSHIRSSSVSRPSRSDSYAATHGGYANADGSSISFYNFEFTLPASFLSNTYVIAFLKIEERTSQAQRAAGNAYRHAGAHGTQLEQSKHQNILMSILQDNFGTKTMMTNIRSVQFEMHIASPPIVSCRPTIRSANFLLSSKDLQVDKLINLRYSYSGGEEGATTVAWYRCMTVCTTCQSLYINGSESESCVSDDLGDKSVCSTAPDDCTCVLELIKQGVVLEQPSICEYLPALCDANMFLRAEITPVSCHGIVGEKYVLLSTRIIVEEKQIIKTCTLEKVDTSHALLNIVSLAPIDLEIYWYQEIEENERIYIPEFDNDRIFDLKSSIIEQYHLYGSILIVCEVLLYPVPINDAERYSNNQSATSAVPLLKKTLKTEFYVNTVRRNTPSRTPRTRSISSRQESKGTNPAFTPTHNPNKQYYNNDDSHGARVAHTSEFTSQKTPFRGSYFDRAKQSPLWQDMEYQNESCGDAVKMQTSYSSSVYCNAAPTAAIALNPGKKSARFSDDQDDSCSDALGQIARQLQTAVGPGKLDIQNGPASIMNPQLSRVKLEISQPATVLNVIQPYASRGSRVMINAYNDSRTDTNSFDVSEDGDVGKNIIASRQRLSRIDQSRASEVPKSLVLQESNYMESYTTLHESVDHINPAPVRNKQDGIQFEFPSNCVDNCSMDTDNNIHNSSRPMSYRDLVNNSMRDHIITSKGILSPIVVMTNTTVHQNNQSRSRLGTHHMTSSTVEVMDVTQNIPNDIYIQRPERRRSSRQIANVTNSEPSEPSRISDKMSTSESIPEIAISPQPLDLPSCAREIEIPIDSVNPVNLYSDLMESAEGATAATAVTAVTESAELTDGNAVYLAPQPSKLQNMKLGPHDHESDCSGIEAAVIPESTGSSNENNNANIRSLNSISQSFSQLLDSRKGYVAQTLESTSINMEPVHDNIEQKFSINALTPSYRGSSASETVKSTRAFENEMAFKNNVTSLRVTKEAHMVGDVLGFEVYGAIDQGMSVFIVRSYADGVFFESGLTRLNPIKLVDYCQLFAYRVTPFDLGSSLRVIVRADGSFGSANLIDRLLDATIIGASDKDISLLMWRRVCADRTYRVDCECKEDGSFKQGSASVAYNGKIFSFKYNKKLIYSCKDMKKLPYEIEFTPILTDNTLLFSIKGPKPTLYSLLFQRVEDLGFIFYRLLCTTGLSLLYH